MHIQISTSFVASTAVPMIKTVFDVYATQHFEVQFDIKDDQNKDSLKKNLSKTVKTLILLESELSKSEYRVFFDRFIEVFAKYRYYFFASKRDCNFGYRISTLTEQDFTFKLCDAVEAEKARQAKLNAKRALKAQNK